MQYSAGKEIRAWKQLQKSAAALESLARKKRAREINAAVDKVTEALRELNAVLVLGKRAAKEG